MAACSSQALPPPSPELRFPSWSYRTAGSWSEISSLDAFAGDGQTVWRRRQLGDPHVVAERVAQPEVRAVEVRLQLGRELDASRLQRLVRLRGVVGDQPQREPGCAFGHQVAYLLPRLLVHPRRSGQLEKYVTAG